MVLPVDEEPECMRFIEDISMAHSAFLGTTHSWPAVIHKPHFEEAFMKAMFDDVWMPVDVYVDTTLVPVCMAVLVRCSLDHPRSSIVVSINLCTERKINRLRSALLIRLFLSEEKTTFEVNFGRWMWCNFGICVHSWSYHVQCVAAFNHTFKQSWFRHAWKTRSSRAKRMGRISITATGQETARWRWIVFRLCL